MNKKQNKGITLVALVITIIVLIILAGVSINALMNDGLIENAKASRDEWKKQSVTEQIELAKLEGVLLQETLENVNAGEYTGTENKKYVDSSGNIAIIPAGFTVSNVKTDTADETTISGGLVIYSGNVAATDFTTDSDSDGIVNAQESNNQYVWIPVENPSDIYGILESPVEGIEGTIFGKLYDFSSNGIATHLNWPTENGYERFNIM